MKDNKPYWLPEPITERWYQRIARDYDEDPESQEYLRDTYAHGSAEFADVWDHLGDARHDAKKMCRVLLRLARAIGAPLGDVARLADSPLDADELAWWVQYVDPDDGGEE